MPSSARAREVRRQYLGTKRLRSRLNRVTRRARLGKRSLEVALQFKRGGALRRAPLDLDPCSHRPDACSIGAAELDRHSGATDARP
jgi:hypothetical protein